ncbi:MAG: hypothetical protein DI529_10685 [Chryseobacterium sp.]|nr:MAG: hypothetical protein DI529_10685 [Chryseobacterium sp.]
MKKSLYFLFSFVSLLSNAQTKRLFGTTFGGGTSSSGTLFEYNIQTNTYDKKYEFNMYTDVGIGPIGSLLQASNGKLYGTTTEGGAVIGVLFEYDPATNIYTKKIDFNGDDSGGRPNGNLIQLSNGKLYGTTNSGGAYASGVLFEYNPATNTYTKKIEFNYLDLAGSGSAPSLGGLLHASNNKLYGMTSHGGLYAGGILYEYNPDNDTYSKLLDFDSAQKGSHPYGGLIQASNGKLYGLTSDEYASSLGTLFEYNLENNSYTKLIDFDGAEKGANPYGSLTQASNGKLYGMTSQGGAFSLGTLFQYDIVTNTYSKLLDFDGSQKGSSPYGSLMQASDGKLYGQTLFGGADNMGVLFQYDYSTNTYTKLKDLNSTMGGYPYYNAGLIELKNQESLSTNNNFKNDIKIFPNPVKSTLFINAKEKFSVYEIYTANGRKSMLGVLQNASSQIHVSQLSRGVYVLRLTTDNGEIFVQKFIKE